jgi:pimeloyl-ACP methyl ester carboxylesterase
MNLGVMEDRRSSRMPRKKTQAGKPSRNIQSAVARTAPPTVSGRWILAALGIVFAAAALCAWVSLCLLFWQGAWQLLYRPATVVARTPAAAGLAFSSIGFETTDAGTPRLQGWWIPAPAGGAAHPAPARYTALYLHDRIGNLGDCIDQLAAIHAAGVNIFAFDYRGYGQSEFVRPSEAHWREDAESALHYLTATRQTPANSIVLVGSGLGADLALEVAAAHPELAGVALDAPVPSPADLVFNDARAHLVPAQMLFRDRYRLREPAKQLRIASLWMFPADSNASAASEKSLLDAYSAVPAPKTLVHLSGRDFTAALTRWLTGLGTGR